MSAIHNKLHAHYGDTSGFPFTNGTGSQLDGGSIHSQGNKVGVVYDDTPDTEDGILVTAIPAPGVDVPKQALAWSAGDAVVYDSGTNDFTNDTAQGTIVGYAYESAAGGDAEGRVVLTDESV